MNSPNPNRPIPRVSIGLAVYNGERYLAEAIDSILAQTFDDFELIICDNASTDATEEICRGYCERDSRVTYSRNETNIGPAANHNRIFHLARGEFFKWAAHDDACKPEFVERCIQALDSDPSIVLAATKVQRIDEASQPLAPYDYELLADSPRAHERVRGQIRGHQCYEIFGLIRREALLKTDLFGDYFACDAILLMRLVLMGRFYEAPEPLFLSRSHPQQSEALRNDMRAYAEWYQMARDNPITLPYWRVLGEYWRAIRSAEIPAGERLRCYPHLARWTLARWKHLIHDVGRASAQGVGRLLRSSPDKAKRATEPPKDGEPIER